MPLRVYNVFGAYPMLIIAESDQDALFIDKEVNGEFDLPVELEVIPDQVSLELLSLELDPEYNTYAYTQRTGSDEDSDWKETKLAQEWAQELGRGVLALDGYDCCAGHVGGYYRFLWQWSRKKLQSAA